MPVAAEIIAGYAKTDSATAVSGVIEGIRVTASYTVDGRFSTAFSLKFQVVNCRWNFNPVGSGYVANNHSTPCGCMRMLILPG